jgi:AcrR family transcriptional regulator
MIRWQHSTSTTTPKQARSQARLERILDAAEHVFARVGFESASIAQIMRRAKSSVGVFYQRFQSKEEIFGAVVQRFTEQAINSTDELFTSAQYRPTTPTELLPQVMPLLVSVYRERRGLLRAILLRASVDPSIHAQAHRAERHIEQHLERLIFPEGNRSPDRRTLFRLAYQMLRSALNTMILFDVPEKAGLHLDDPDLERHLTLAFLRLIGERCRDLSFSEKRPSARQPNDRLSFKRRSS